LGYFLGAGTTPSSQRLESPPKPGRFSLLEGSPWLAKIP
jgi:hypothetical protein